MTRRNFLITLASVLGISFLPKKVYSQYGLGAYVSHKFERFFYEEELYLLGQMSANELMKYSGENFSFLKKDDMKLWQVNYAGGLAYGDNLGKLLKVPF